MQLNVDTIGEILDMPTEGEVLSEPILTSAEGKVQMNLTNIDCMGQDELCKNDTHGDGNYESFCITGKESDYIDIDDLY